MSDETLTEWDAAAVARRAIPLLDLTDLGDDCTGADVASLCATARRASVAAVCVWPRFVRQARSALDGSQVRVATVVNFPDGREDVASVTDETRATMADGAQEIDLVLPYRALMRAEPERARDMVRRVREVCGEVPLKVILETGVLVERQAVAAASRIALAEGADFLKTSTGKTARSATPEAVASMLSVLRTNSGRAGLKVSGGIRSVADAARYLALADAIMGPDWIGPGTFRFGASSLYEALARASGAHA